MCHRTLHSSHGGLKDYIVEGHSWIIMISELVVYQPILSLLLETRFDPYSSTP